MKQIILCLTLLVSVLTATAQNSDCSTLNHLLDLARSLQLQTIGTGTAFKTADDMDAQITTVNIGGASKCYIQDAFVGKMYVAEYEKASGSTMSPALKKSFEEKAAWLRKCLTVGFVENKIKTDENIFGASEFHGNDKNSNIKVGLYFIYNPGDKAQSVYITIIKD
jgi:hypothetical protein